MLSPATYARVLLPWHQEMVAAINGPTILHICGDITPRLAMMKRIGMTCFNFDWAIAPQRRGKPSQESASKSKFQPKAHR